MKTHYQTQLWMSALALVLAIGQGCSSHSVGYTVDSESGPHGSSATGMTDSSGHPINGDGDYASGRSFSESGESYDPGAINSSRGYGWGVTPDRSGANNGTSNYDGVQYVNPETGMAYDGGSDYGHNYAGVSGHDSNNGPVTGFGSGSAESVNPTPEEWAEAFLRGNASGAGSSDGGLLSEHVDQDMFVAKSGSSFRQAQGDPGSSVSGRHMGGANGHVQDVYFEFDSWKISKEGVYSLQNDADWLRAHPGQPVTIEGHCDSRGTQNYNMVLGRKRAEAARAYLIDLGVDASQLRVVSYGKERPFCSEHNEHCYQQNRRGHMSVGSH